MDGTVRALLLYLADLIIGEPQALHVPTYLSQRVGRDWLALRRAQAVKARAGPFQLRIEAADAEPNQRCLHSVDDPTSLSDEAVMLAVGPLGILVLHCGDLADLAVFTLAAQPAKKGAFDQLGVEPIGLGTPMLARHRYARCVNDVGLEAARLEPARQPEAVTASLKGDCNALDPASCFLRFLSPSMQQLQQCALVDPERCQRLALDARHDTSNEPARKAHLNDRNQRAVRLEGGEGSAQVVQLLHGVAPSVHISDDGMQYPRRRPIASSIIGFEDEVEQSLPQP